MRYPLQRVCLFFLFLCFCSFSSAGAASTSKFVVLTPPKCGTFLLVKSLNLLLDKKETRWLGWLKPKKETVMATEIVTNAGGFVVAHNWTKEILDELVSRGYKIIFILRDPRDHLISVQDWAHCPNWGGPKHITTITDPDAQLEELITGNIYGWRCYEFIRSRLNLLSTFPQNVFYVARYENLVGPKGGGSRENQIQELAGIADFLGFEASYQKLEQVADSLWGSSATFHVGQIGRWIGRMKPHHIELYKALYQLELEKLGYVKSSSW